MTFSVFKTLFNWPLHGRCLTYFGPCIWSIAAGDQVITCPNDLFIAGSYPIQLTEGIGRFSAPYADANNETHLEQPNQVDEDTGDHGLSALWTWTVSDGPAILHALTDILAEVSFLVHIDLSKVS